MILTLKKIGIKLITILKIGLVKSQDQIPFRSGEINSIPYAHGGFFGKHDRIGAILVIAVFYTTDIDFGWLSAAVIGVADVGLWTKYRVWYTPLYAVIGVIIWYATFRSGVHATIAGVMVAMVIPVRPVIDPAKFIDVTSGLKPGGTILINTEKAPEEYPNLLERFRVATIDASGIAVDGLADPALVAVAVPVVDDDAGGDAGTSAPSTTT